MDAELQRLVDRVRGAPSAGETLAIRGSGSKAFLGEAARGADFDVRGLRGISVYEPTELVVSARCGTPLAELEAALAERDQCLPFEPPHFGPDATVGGMVAAGLAGPARAAVGAVRDHLLGATLLNGRGEVLSFGGQVMKNVAGYDLSRLLAGSMGVLGVICEVSLKVLPVPRALATLRFEMDQQQALAALAGWGGQPLPIGATAWWQGMLVVRLQGAAAAVEAARGRLGGEAVDVGAAHAFWLGLREQTDEYFAAAAGAIAADPTRRLWRVSLPQTAAVLGLAGDELIEWGGAQRWLCTAAPAADVRAAAVARGGHATIFRAQDKSAGAFMPLAPAQFKLQRALCQAFDPHAIFDRGRLYPGL